MIYIDNVLRAASDEVGYLEKATNAYLDDKTANAGTGNYTKYARDLWDVAKPAFYQGPKNGYDWCAVFVDWCLWIASGMDSNATKRALCYTGPYGAGCGMSVAYYKEAGRWHNRKIADALYTPKPGDQIFFGSEASIRHTGIVERVYDGKVYTVEGNADNSVRRRCYALSSSDIAGYGSPRYDGDTDPHSKPVFVDVPPKAWYADAVKACYDTGIMIGVDDEHFAPNKVMTRAEAAVALAQVLKLIGK